MKIIVAVVLALSASAAYADQIEIEYPAGVFTKAGDIHNEQDNSPAMVAKLEHTLLIERGKSFAVWINRPEGFPGGICDHKLAELPTRVSGIYTDDYSAQCYTLGQNLFAEIVGIKYLAGRRPPLTEMRVAVASKDVFADLKQVISSAIRWYGADPVLP